MSNILEPDSQVVLRVGQLGLSISMRRPSTLNGLVRPNMKRRNDRFFLEVVGITCVLPRHKVENRPAQGSQRKVRRVLILIWLLGGINAKRDGGTSAKP